jgi:hypothetical protein
MVSGTPFVTSKPMAAHPLATDYERARAAGLLGAAPTVDGSGMGLVPSQRTEYEINYLKSLGWEVPTDSPLLKAPMTDADMYAEDSVNQLASYTYQVDKAERDRITAKYRTVEGFAPPATVSGMPDPDTVPFEAEVETVQLTWDEYNRLSDDQRNAVDLNDLMVAAREADLSKEYVLKGEELEEYNRRTEALFGRSDTSEKIAPNLVRLLTDIKWEAVGHDLDEYISLDRAFTLDEIKNLNMSNVDFERLRNTAAQVSTNPGGYGSTVTAPASTNFARVRSPEELAKADAALIAAAGARIEEVMGNPTFNLWDLESSMNYAMNPEAGRPTGSLVPFGYGFQTDRTSVEDQNKEAVYQSAFNMLTDANTTDLQPLWDEMEYWGFNDKDVNEFWQFVDDRTRKEQRYGQVGSPYGEPNRRYRTPDEIRKLVGLED